MQNDKVEIEVLSNSYLVTFTRDGGAPTRAAYHSVIEALQMAAQHICLAPIEVLAAEKQPFPTDGSKP